MSGGYNIYNNNKKRAGGPGSYRGGKGKKKKGPSDDNRKKYDSKNKGYGNQNSDDENDGETGDQPHPGSFAMEIYLQKKKDAEAAPEAAPGARTDAGLVRSGDASSGDGLPREPGAE